MIPQVFFSIMKMQYQVLTSHQKVFDWNALHPGGSHRNLLRYDIFFHRFMRLTGDKISVTILSPPRTSTSGAKIGPLVPSGLEYNPLSHS